MNDNELISEFMTGYDFEHIEGGYPVGSFDNNWHYLMPVVDKIESIRGVFRKGGMTNGGQQLNATEPSSAY